MLDQINVKTTSKQTHELLIKFTNNYVDDELMYKSGDKTKGYYIVNGVKEKPLVFDTEHKNTKKNKRDKSNLENILLQWNNLRIIYNTYVMHIKQKTFNNFTNKILLLF